jgi:prepilin-type processing-associated H-X9-DG protein/prepilin-type N-terminal cleavage/methylation domain-containing protein
LPPAHIGDAPPRGGNCRSATRRLHPAGFTIVELLMAIGVICLLASLLVVAASSAHGVAQRAACLNRLHEIGLASQQFLNAREKYPWAWVSETRRWMDQLLPYLDNSKAVLLCPADQEKKPLPWDPEFVMSYGINVFRFKDDAHCFWFPVEMRNVLSPRNVILFADCKSGTYYCGGGNRYKEPVGGVAYRHPGNTFNAVFCDGHAETRKETERSDWDASQ